MWLKRGKGVEEDGEGYRKEQFGVFNKLGYNRIDFFFYVAVNKFNFKKYWIFSNHHFSTELFLL